jgi:hypothetical protein
MVAIAVASTVGVAGTASAGPVGRSARIAPRSDRQAGARGVDCRFTTVTPHRTGGHRHAPATQQTGAAAADLSVGIPPVVLIHHRGRDLDVFTNTGARPQLGDEFYALDGRRGGPASAELEREVIQRCSGGGRPSDPH